MRVDEHELRGLRGQVAMVDGGFDPLHQGHIAYFEKAAQLGAPVLCSVTSDDYVGTKHRPLLKQEQRARIIDALRPISYTYVNGHSTASVLRELAPRYYVKGKDWEGRLPEEEQSVCQELGVEIVYADTVLDSSSQIIGDYCGAQAIGKQVEGYEGFVQSQEAVRPEKYDEDYFQDDWRAAGNSYKIEDRRRIEAKNPQLIKDVFQPRAVLDMGCGPGALMYFLWELGVDVEGVDFSQDCKDIAQPEVRERIRIGEIDKVELKPAAYDLVICREVFEHLTVLQVQKAVENICRAASDHVYVTTRFHPAPKTLFDVTTEFDVDPTHVTLMNMDMLRLMFVLQGFERRRDLEQKMDWLDKRRVLVYQRTAKAR